MVVMTLPSEADVLAALRAVEPGTVRDVHDALPPPWNREWAVRGTVRNRLYALEDAGIVRSDGGRPLKFATAEALDSSTPKPLGIPYAGAVELNGVWGQECPLCGKFCPPDHMKDPDSFVGSYARHYGAEHEGEAQ